MNIKKILASVPLCVVFLASLAIMVLLGDDLSRKLYWSGDYAIFLLDMYHASDFEQMLGIPSRFGWAHPGPLNYYLLLPGFILSNGGDQSLIFGTFVFNIFCFFCSIKLIERMIGLRLSIAFLIIFSAYIIVALGAKVFFDVLIPFATILPWAFAICLACMVALRSLKYAILLAFVLAYVTQMHVAFWMPSIVLAITAICISLTLQKPAKKDLVYLLFASLLFVLLWLPPIFELNNLLLIFKFFSTQAAPQHSYGEAFRALAVLVGEPLMGHGLSYANNKAENVSFFVGGILLGIAPLLTWLGYRRRNKFTMVLGLIVIFQTLSYLFSLTKVVGPILHHSVTFFPIIGVFIIIQFFSSLIPDENSREASLIAKSVDILGVILLLSYFSNDMGLALADAKKPDPLTMSLSEKLLSEVKQCSSSPTIIIDQKSWVSDIGAISYLYRSGEKFSVYPPNWSIVFGGRVPVAVNDCRVGFSSTNGTIDVVTTDYANKAKYRIVSIAKLSDLNFSHFGAADFGDYSVRSSAYIDAALVSQELALPKGIYKAEFTFDYDVDGEIMGSHGGHFSEHGQKLLLPILTGRGANQHATIYFDADGRPVRFSFGLGGWAKGRGFVELKQLTISSVSKLDE